jgi:ATP-binding cassette subfamily B (MDR/TAP) protein 1
MTEQQPIAFFDRSANAPGILVSHLAIDPDAVKSLAGANLGVIGIFIVSLLSTVILSLVIGWKLAIVAIFGALPLIFGAALLRERTEQSFAEKTSETFSGSVGFASDCMRALRTVVSCEWKILLSTSLGACFKSIVIVRPNTLFWKCYGLY